MCAHFLAGLPFLGDTVQRGRLLERATGANSRPLAVVAPSGYGKTSLAAQIAERVGSFYWLDCCGEPPESFERILSSRLGAEGSRTDMAWHVSETPLADGSVEGEGARTCIILDDVDLQGNPEGIAGLSRLAHMLSSAGCLLVVTARNDPAAERHSLRGFDVLGENELRLSVNETLELAEILWGSPARIEQIGDVHESSGGHAALVAVMLQALGPDSLTRAVASLDRVLEDLLSTRLLTEEIPVLQAAAMIRSGSLPDLDLMGVRASPGMLGRIAECLPLVRVSEDVGPRAEFDSFCIHDILADFIMRRSPLTDGGASSVERAIGLLSSRGDYRRASELLVRAEAAFQLDYLDEHGFFCLQSGCTAQLGRVLQGIPLHEVAGRPLTLLLWSDVLMDGDAYEEALAKGRAARVLAQHGSDATLSARATANCLDALRMLNRWDETSELLTCVPELLDANEIPLPAKAALVRAAAPLHLLAGDYPRGERLLQAVCAMQSGGDSRVEADQREAAETLALIPCFQEGDFVATAQALSPWAAIDEGTVSRRVDARGNLAVSLIEMGRTTRAAGLLRRVVEMAGDSGLAYYLPVLGSLQFAQGQEVQGLQSVRDGIAKALERGAEAEAAQNRVFEAMLLRAAGRLEDSLTSAERAHERLCIQDFFHFQRLAALEIAASLLSLGDTAAARAWADSVFEAGFGENLHHEYRAEMVLALCDLNDGDRASAVGRLSRHTEHLRTGNSNFQVAMYVRAFPQLLGLIVEGAGAASVPSHLLQMVPGRSAEVVLRECQEPLSAEEWSALGRRLLGEEPFGAYVERKGKPLCRVRMFGGLEVSVGERTIHDREWKKRKARMLFAMLVARRGNEIAREQVLDTLWADLPQDRAKNNFYVAWSAMKTALMGRSGTTGSCAYVDNSGGRCRAIPASVLCDIDEFDTLVLAARTAEVEGDYAFMIEQLETVSLLYHGDLMAGDPYEDWIAPLRDRYRREFVNAMSSLARVLLRIDDPCRALLYVRRALEIDPREDLYQTALRCHIAAGQRNAAVETFVNCRSQLADDLGLDPSAETLALYQQILVMEDRPRIDDYGLG